MVGDLVKVTNDDIRKYLKPVEARTDIARLTDDLADKFYSAKYGPDSQTVRLSPVYFGRYGVLGYVEMNMLSNTSKAVEAWEIITVPDSLWKNLESVKGLRGYLREAIFEDKEMKPESLDHPSLQGITLLDKPYSWVLYDGGRYPWHEIPDLIKLVKESIIERITRFDETLDKLVPPERRPTFEGLDLTVLNQE